MKITVEYVIYMNSYKRGEGKRASFTKMGGMEQLMCKVTWSKIGDNGGGGGEGDPDDVEDLFKIFAQVLM